MAIGSPLDPILKNIFMRDFKEKWARTSKNRPSGWFRYVDDIFALFDDKKSVSIFTISQQSPQRHKIHYRILRERRNCFFRYSCKTLRWQRFHDFGIRDLTKIPCGNRENDKLTASGIWLFPGKRDSPTTGHGIRDLCLCVCQESGNPPVLTEACSGNDKGCKYETIIAK